jgi:hypothetical protein
MAGHTRGGGHAAMTFEEVVDQALAMLQRRGRVTYRMLHVDRRIIFRQSTVIIGVAVPHK